MNAVEELWGEGDSRQRRLAYMNGHGAALHPVPQRRRGEDVLRAVDPERLERGGRSHVAHERQGRRAGDGRLQAESEPPGRGALHHSRVRRSGPCAAGARGREGLREDRSGGVARRPHADAHLHPARDVERGREPEHPRLQRREGTVAARRRARRHVAFRRLGSVRLPAARRLRRRARAHPGVRVDGGDHQEPARDGRAAHWSAPATSSRPKSGRCSRWPTARRTRRSSPTGSAP